MFSIKDKVALVTGGASGIGLQFAKELLRNELRAVVIADVDVENGAKAVQECEQQFGRKRAAFIEADISHIDDFKKAFELCIEQYQQIDILINNAGVFNDSIWQQEIAVNVNGTINGIILALENYIRKFKTGSEGVIVNISSICGIEGYNFNPIYCATKFAIIGLTKSWGTHEHYERTGIKVLALCPGLTDTRMVREMDGRFLNEDYEKMYNLSSTHKIQSTKDCADAIIKILENGKTGTVWVSEFGEEPYEFVISNRGTMEN